MTTPKITNYAVNGSGGATVKIPLTIQASFVRVQEDPTLNAGVAQGIEGYLLDAVTGARASTRQYWPANTAGQEGPAYQPIELGDPRRVHGQLGEPLGFNGAYILELISHSATATGVIVAEYI